MNTSRIGGGSRFCALPHHLEEEMFGALDGVNIQLYITLDVTTAMSSHLQNHVLLSGNYLHKMDS